MTPGLSPELVGLSAPAFAIDVTWKRSSAYAAATGDANPRYLDDRVPDHLLAPPLMAAALTASGNAEIGSMVLEASGLAVADFARQVHFTEVIEFDRPLRPGTSLAITPCVAAVRPHRLGTEFVLRFEALSEGRPVFREHLGTLVRDVFTDGLTEAVELPGTPTVARDDRVDGHAVWSADDAYDALAAHIYDSGSGISYPVHTSPAFAARAGLPAPLVHGTAVLARSVRHYVDRELGGDAARIGRVAVSFAGMVLPGSTVRTFGFASPAGFLALDATSGQPVLRNGRVDHS